MLNIDATYGHTAALGHLAREFAPGRMYGLKGAGKQAHTEGED